MKGPAFEDVAAEPRRVTRPSLRGTHGRRSRTLPVASAREEFKDEGARCFAETGSVRACDFRKARSFRTSPPNLVALRGHCWERPTAGAQGRCRSRARGKSLRARARAVLAGTVLGRSRKHRARARFSPPNLVASHGYRWEGPIADARGRCRSRARVKCLREWARAVLTGTVLGRSRQQRMCARVLPTAHTRAIFERPGVRGRCHRTSSRCTAIVGRDWLLFQPGLSRRD